MSRMRWIRCQESCFLRENIPSMFRRPQTTQSHENFAFFLGSLGRCCPFLPCWFRWRLTSCLHLTYLMYCCPWAVTARLEALAVTDKKIHSSCPEGIGLSPWLLLLVLPTSTSCRIGGLVSCWPVGFQMTVWDVGVRQVGENEKCSFKWNRHDFLSIVETLHYFGW